jgi:hypothetical protein
MKTNRLLRFWIMSAAVLFVTSVATQAFCAVDAFIVFKDANGKTTRVKVNSDGTFSAPSLPAGTYRWSFGATQPNTPSSSMGGGSAREAESISFNFTKIEIKYEVQTAREAGSGMATGKRQHKPLTIRKEIDKASPQLYNAELGTVTVDADGDGISGTVSAVTKKGNTTMWDLATGKM